MNKFWQKILSSKDATSSKRLVTLIISLHFIIASFAILFIAFYVIFYLPKGKVEPELLGLLKEVLGYDFYIILSGLGFITADNLGQILLEKAKIGRRNDFFNQYGTGTYIPEEKDTVDLKQGGDI